MNSELEGIFCCLVVGRLQYLQIMVILHKGDIEVDYFFSIRE
jgi:hypothetical protein